VIGSTTKQEPAIADRIAVLIRSDLIARRARTANLEGSSICCWSMLCAALNSGFTVLTRQHGRQVRDDPSTAVDI